MSASQTLTLEQPSASQTLAVDDEPTTSSKRECPCKPCRENDHSGCEQPSWSAGGTKYCYCGERIGSR